MSVATYGIKKLLGARCSFCVMRFFAPLAYIMTDKYNVINADWEVLARWPCYFQAVNNLKPVAKCTAHFLVNLEKILGVQYEKITCVGFSLGAHVCGLIQNYVADKMEKIIGEQKYDPQDLVLHETLSINQTLINEFCFINRPFSGKTSFFAAL
jgi:Lipase